MFPYISLVLAIALIAFIYLWWTKPYKHPTLPPTQERDTINSYWLGQATRKNNDPRELKRRIKYFLQRK
jgi:hypothetical protein